MIAKFRCSNIKFPIEAGRWNEVPKHERICNLRGNGIGDEFHYLFICENKKLKPLGKSSFLYIIRNIQPN
jgi:hypothetical protein